MALSPIATQNAFNVRLISPISSAGSYRVFVERSDLLFIQLEGGVKSVVVALAPLLGPLGGLVPVALWLFAKKKARERRRQLDQKNPEDLLFESKANFRLHHTEIREAAIEPPSLFAAGGKAGRLILIVRHGERIKGEFATGGEVNKAIHLLAPLLHATLRINPRWNATEAQFERQKPN